MRLSIVTSMYYSASYLEEFYTRICRGAQKVTNDFEIIFVNDGSPDNSIDIAISLYEKDKRIRVIDLSRNFGHHKAMMTGIAHAKGDLIFLIDCDLEEEPELLERFHGEFIRSGADVVFGVQDMRKGSLFERFTGSVFYKLFNWLSTYPVPANLITTRLMSKRYVKGLIAHKDKEIFLAGLWAITGFKQVPIVVHKYSKGNSTYNLVRKVKIFINSVTSFSNKPLVFIFYLGSLISISATIAAFYLTIRRLFFGVLMAGWPSTMVSIWLLGGLTIFCLGLIGIYLSKIYMETKQRPYTLIRNIYEHTE